MMNLIEIFSFIHSEIKFTIVYRNCVQMSKSIDTEGFKYIIYNIFINI